MTDKELVECLKMLKESATPIYEYLTERHAEYTCIEDVSVGSFVWVIDEAMRRIKESSNDTW